MLPDFIIQLQQRLQQPLPGRAAHMLMAPASRKQAMDIPPDVRSSGVLLLLYPKGDVLYTILMQRVEDGKTHSGQMSLPGGKTEPEDADIIDTALREAWEEVGVVRDEVTVLGKLSPLFIPVSNFMVNPVVAYSETIPVFRADAGEVAGILEVPIEELFRDSIKSNIQVRPSSSPNLTMDAPAYLVYGKVIWGATAMILSELEVIWNQIQ